MRNREIFTTNRKPKVQGVERKQQGIHEAPAEVICLEVNSGGIEMDKQYSGLRNKSIVIPCAVLAYYQAGEVDDKLQTRLALRDSLSRGETTYTSPVGVINKEGQQEVTSLQVPNGILGNYQAGEVDDKLQTRLALRDSLSRGETTYTSPVGVINKEGQQEVNSLQVPPGILSCDQAQTGDQDDVQKETSTKGENVESQDTPDSPKFQRSEHFARQREVLREMLPKEGSSSELMLNLPTIKADDEPRLIIPTWICSSDPTPKEDERMNQELARALLGGVQVDISPLGVVTMLEKQGDASANPIEKPSFLKENDQDMAKRHQVRAAMIEDSLVLDGERMLPDQDRNDTDPAVQPESNNALDIPPGILAASFYWYERNQQLLDSEIASMKHFFPTFCLEKMNDGRLCWRGTFYPTNLRTNARWDLKVVYQHNHPSHSTYGGSIRVYSESPNLEDISRRLGEAIPHAPKDENGKYFLCTNRTEDMKIGNHQTSAASALGWAAKWIAIFEMWLAGDITTAEFSSHKY